MRYRLVVVNGLLDQYDVLGALRLDGPVIVGELGEGLETDVSPGVFNAYFLDMEDADREDAPPSRLLLVAERVADDAEDLLDHARERGSVPVDNGSMIVADSEVADDLELLEDAAMEGVHGVFADGRAVRVGLEGDLEGLVRIAADAQGHALLIAVDFV